MKTINRLTVLLGLILMHSSLSAQDTLLYQDFQDESFGQFQNIDLDGLDLSADFAGLTSAFNIIPVSGLSDFRAVGVSSFASSGTADNWLITPAIEITNLQAKLRWTAASLSGDPTLLESYSVLLSTTGSETNDFSVTLLEVGEEEMAEKTREVDLSSYINQSVYIAFRHTGMDNYALTLDDILVTAPSSQNAVKLVKICGERYQDVVQPELTLQVVNVGSEIINDLLVAGSINGDVGETAFNDLNILPQDTAYIPFADLYPFGADRYNIVAEVTSVNSTPVMDEIKAGTFFMVANPPTRKLVLEEATSTTCGWCPEGVVQKEFMQSVIGTEVINMSVHKDDPMEQSLYSLGLENLEGFAGFPSATLNRENSVPPHAVGLYYANDFSQVAPSALDIEYDYDSATRILAVTFTGIAHTSLYADLHRFSLVLLEDNVQGNSPDFAQANNYSSDASDIFLESVSGVNWRDLTNPVPAAQMTYDDVVRDVVGGFDGILESINDVRDGDSFSYQLEYTLSSAFDEDEIWLVAMIIDSESGTIVSAAEEQMLFESGLGSNEDLVDLAIYPNPANERVTISFLENKSEFSLDIFDNNGNRVLENELDKKIYSGTKIELDIKHLASGMYTIKLASGDEILLKKLIIL